MPSVTLVDLIGRVARPSPIERASQIVGIAVVLSERSDATVRALHAWMAAHLAEPKMPSRWWLVDEIPRTSRGKINREAVKTACTGRPALELVRILGEKG